MRQKFFQKIAYRKAFGFTLIELLVVIAIIAVLAAVVLVALGSARTRARDARRLGDIKQFSLALDVYADIQGEEIYPAVTPLATGPDNAQFVDIGNALVAQDLIQAPPADPITNTGRNYVGQIASDRKSFLVGADLEESNSACNSDYDGVDIDPLSTDTACAETTPGDCLGTEADGADYCLCKGPACG